MRVRKPNTDHIPIHRIFKPLKPEHAHPTALRITHYHM